MAAPRMYRPTDDPWMIPVIPAASSRSVAELPRGYANRAMITRQKLVH